MIQAPTPNGLSFDPLALLEDRRFPVQTLLDAGSQALAFDPEGKEAAAAIMPEVQMMISTYAAIDVADPVGPVTEWGAFRVLDFSRVRSLMKAPVLVNLRNACDPAETERQAWPLAASARGGRTHRQLGWS